MKIHSIIAEKSSATEKQVSGIVALLESGATVPFISRYRKEQIFGADEVIVAAVKREHEKILAVEKRKETIIASLTESGNLTAQLRQTIEECYDSVRLEDIYLPFRPKKRTRATIAKERGLEPLANMVLEFRADKTTPLFNKAISKELPTYEDVISGVCDIIAERVNESDKARGAIRIFMSRSTTITSKVVKGKESEGEKYSDYFNFSGELHKQPSHRIMALLRAEKEGYIRVKLENDREEAKGRIERYFIKAQTNNFCRQIISKAIEDGYKRLLEPSLHSEMMSAAREKAYSEATTIFSSNLKQLLLAPPLQMKRILAIDPGFRTGCKVVCLNEYGDLVHNETIYPHEPKKEFALAMKKVSSMVESYKIESIAIGDGTASRETEAFIKQIHFPHNLEVYMVSEDGASIYSASSVAREEFPDYDITVRGAVSIGRRLMDPLAELVKIDPQSLGIGQYQHDVDQTMLKNALNEVVEYCVNKVGVNLNTASYHLLSHVAGIGKQLAQNIVEYRSANGEFFSRSQLLKVPRLGAKAYEQCAGFLRVNGGKNPLDGSAVHPESYHIVEKMASDCGCKSSELLKNKELRQKIDPKRYISTSVGLPTIIDIISELEKPGLDPRGAVELFEFDKSITTINDLREGMELNGLVTNITNFGAFVDLGIKENGLVHISQICNKFISSPSEVLSLHQKVRVKVLEIDRQRKRIALTMKDIDEAL